MAYTYYGVAKTLRTWSSSKEAISVVPDFEEPGKDEPIEHFVGVVHALEEVQEIVVEIVDDAESTQPPASPVTLQDLVAAGRIRLRRQRALLDRTEVKDALEHAKAIEGHLRQ